MGTVAQYPVRGRLRDLSCFQAETYYGCVLRFSQRNVPIIDITFYRVSRVYTASERTN